MKSVLRASAAMMVLVLAGMLLSGCPTHQETRIIEVHGPREGVPVGPPTPVIVPDGPVTLPPPPPPPPPPPGGVGEPVLVPDEGDIIVPE